MVARRQCLVVVVGVGRKQRRGMTRGVDDEWGSSGGGGAWSLGHHEHTATRSLVTLGEDAQVGGVIYYRTPISFTSTTSPQCQ